MCDADASYVPACKSGAGCPIEDLASDPVVNEFLDRYRLAKHLRDCSDLSIVEERMVEELGLLEHPETHARLELLWIKNQQRQNQKKQAKQAHQRASGRGAGSRRR